LTNIDILINNNQTIKIFFQKIINSIQKVGKIGSLAFAEGLALCVEAKDNVPMWAGNKIVLKKNVWWQKILKTSGRLECRQINFFFQSITVSLKVCIIVKVQRSCHCPLPLAPNVLALGAVADFGAQNCQYTTKVDAR